MSKKSRRVARARRVLLSLSLVLVTMLVAVGGTIAWLTDSTETVINSFTSSTINVDIAETGTTEDANKNETKSFQVIPGKDIEKDPKVTASASANVDYYVFVTVTKENWNSNLSYEIASGWKGVPGNDGVYYKEMPAGEKLTNEPILKDNKIVVSNALTKENLEVFDTAAPTLTFQAFAIQKAQSNTANFTVEEAWNQVKPTTSTPEVEEPAGN